MLRLTSSRARLARFAASLVARLDMLRAATSGATAVEFAIVLPVALLLYVGASEITDGVMAGRRATTVARTLVDLVALQGTTIQATSTPTPANAVNAATLTSMLTSATTLMAPQPAAPLTMTVSAIDIINTSQGSCCSALVRWSYTQGGTLRPCSQQMTALPASSDYAPAQLPSALLPYGTTLPAPVSVVIADVGYTYQPLFGTSFVNFAPSIQRTIYMLPRATGQVTTGALPASGTQYGRVCY